MKKSNKGFTLIELLAVIVILGLLMAIAIPSVTRYITQSRKKTLVTTMGNYMKSVMQEVNDGEYLFVEKNTIYALPIECIAVESGGQNPFGEWYDASNGFWAYVLVQYDDLNSNFTYGFTFKDNAGYGLEPITQQKLETSGNQIKTNVGLSRPITGYAKNYVSLDKWTGFVVDDQTTLQVLTVDIGGDHTTTCTRQQTGKNSNDENEILASGTCLKGKCKYKIKKGGVIVITGTGTLSKDAVPELSHATIVILEGFTGIDSDAFKGANKIENVTIPNSVTSIGDGAFSDCNHLETINIPSGIKIIGNSVFAGDKKLVNVNIPSTVTTIGEKAFYRCDKLETITIPASVTKIESQAFDGTNKLLKIIYEGTKAPTCGENAFYNVNGKAKVTVPSGYNSNKFCNVNVAKK